MVKANYQYQQHPHVEERKAAEPHITHHRKPRLSLNDRIEILEAKIVKAEKK